MNTFAPFQCGYTRAGVITMSSAAGTLPIPRFLQTTLAGESLNCTRRSLIAALSLLAGARALGAASALPTSAVGSKRFELFDGLGHRGKPDPRRLGLQPLAWVGNIWLGGKAQETLDEAGVRAALRQLPAGTDAFYLDIEAWPLLGQLGAVRERHVEQLLRVADLARENMPRAQFGFYGLPPVITYWPLVDGKRGEYTDWIACNRLLEPLAERVDFILPSLYTFYRDRGGWLKYAEATLAAARAYRKPVYPFLWYEYHDSNFLLRGQPVDIDAWIEELKFCRARADGIVFWGGDHRGWSDSAPWWQAVRTEFGLAR
jgi:hypothetical protein